MGQVTVVTTIKRGGSRFYIESERPHVTVPGVTSIVGMVPKPFLQHWSAKLAAELAVDSIDFVKEMAARDRDGAIGYIKGAATRYTKTRATVGSEAHDLFERMIRGEKVRRVKPDLEPYRAGFAEFLDVVNPELIRAEDVAWNDTHQYAGSFDALLRVWLNDDRTPDASRKRGTPVVLVADWKTSKGTYPDVALQMSAYANAERLIDPNGVSSPFPAVDGGVVLHITPEGWEFRPVDISEAVFAHFVALRKTFEWDRELSKTVLGKPLASSAGEFITGTQRRA